ncbi:hypothetical protein FB565_003191 [Actinoplanes lutulentus]|uniref:BON domain-containing protein n=1 Tax=Actinoplanes lutulentus TaxID=1287878 RepID=A0A327YYM8_9ACTN|nr:BON domain-containing protein [Actinoplanes lutulentus]MBB2943478.1 hypothetical protein [Actinoplanes lutulentus]RAK26003.1 BON domain-containing protein [Actinoplanes lutulentus]
MKTEIDTLLTYRVIARIVGDPVLHRQRITVEVHDQVVTLLGRVPSPQARLTAAELARHTPGVRDICNRLRAGGRDRPDEFDELTAPYQPPSPRPANGLALTVALFFAFVTIILALSGE